MMTILKKSEICGAEECIGTTEDEVTGDWGRLRNEELHNLNSSPSVIRMVKSRKMRWAGYIARIGKKINVYRLLVENSERKRILERRKRG
jgi:hypothetical protein